MRLLVVDDESELADAVARAFRKEGYAVDVAYGGHDALEMVRLNPYDLVCLDLTMPDIDGLEVCRRIRADVGSSGAGADVDRPRQSRRSGVRVSTMVPTTTW